MIQQKQKKLFYCNNHLLHLLLLCGTVNAVEFRTYIAAKLISVTHRAFAVLTND